MRVSVPGGRADGRRGDDESMTADRRARASESQTGGVQLPRAALSLPAAARWVGRSAFFLEEDGPFHLGRHFFLPVAPYVQPNNKASTVLHLGDLLTAASRDCDVLVVYKALLDSGHLEQGRDGVI